MEKLVYLDRRLSFPQNLPTEYLEKIFQEDVRNWQEERQVRPKKV